MAGNQLGRWDPMRPEDAAAEFDAWTVSWWVAGGWAIDLTLSHQTRDHGDLDVLVLRRDQAKVREYLRGWEVHAADPPGTLRPWPVGETLPSAVHDIWCRRTPSSRWAFQLLIDDTDGDDWLFRRDNRHCCVLSGGEPRAVPRTSLHRPRRKRLRSYRAQLSGGGRLPGRRAQQRPPTGVEQHENWRGPGPGDWLWRRGRLR